MIYIGLKRGTGIYSMLIRTWTRSIYSHGLIAIEEEDESLTVFEATAKHGVLERTATKEQLLSEGIELHDARKFFSRIPNENETIQYLFRKRLKRQVGKPYDWLAIYYSRIFNIDRENPNAWFCFELIAWAFGMAKSWRWTGRTFQDKLEGVI